MFRRMDKEIKRLTASRDYWKKKAEKLIKENAVLKSKLKNAELELKILRAYEITEQPQRNSPY